MRYRRLDGNGDYSFGHGASNFASGREAVAQAILTRLRWLWNEWWELQGTGFPLLNQVLVYGAQQQKVDMLYADWIKGTEGVTGVQSLTSSIANRRYAMSCVVNTVYGTMSINYPIGGNG